MYITLHDIASLLTMSLFLTMLFTWADILRVLG
jgi:hypothetical protein